MLIQEPSRVYERDLVSAIAMRLPGYTHESIPFGNKGTRALPPSSSRVGELYSRRELMSITYSSATSACDGKFNPSRMDLEVSRRSLQISEAGKREFIIPSSNALHLSLGMFCQ
jgi:hypothetical protein